MSKEIQYSSNSRTGLKKGVDKLANAVKVTLGPKGRNVVIERSDNTPHVTKDGVTVAREITLKDKMENMGAQIIKEAASKTADMAGDGTTTATVLAQYLVSAGLKSVESGSNPIDVKRGIDKAVSRVVGELEILSTPVGEDVETIKQVASISANNDDVIGSLIANAMEKIGKDGVIAVEESKSIETEVKIVEGMQFGDRGYLSPHFVTNPDKMEVDLENPYILITDKKISNMKDLVPMLEKIVDGGHSLFIIADDVEGEALAALVVNKLRGIIKVVAIKAPQFGEKRKWALDDIAILTGGQYISEDNGLKLESIKDLSVLGRCDKVTITKEETTIIGGHGDKNQIKARANEVRILLNQAKGEYETEKLQERLARLVSGVAVLYIGAATEVEMKEKKDRVDDALHATTAAVEEGIVPGGGVAYVRCINSLSDMVCENEDQQTGVDIVKRALQEPLRQIIINAGGEPSVVINKILEGDSNYGYNARTEEYGDMIKMGVIDPKKVSRVALQNAASAASMILTTECAIFDISEKE